ncbi:hypothetical protein CIHG_07922 [Coccidioides immitis H538.4]|uniref:Uncharacterized protein n=3 Tax=Coccidioides immitis TaxID=5501 RepID=A0A0J8R3P4_COCIT|nr:hypothetical protein CIRG_10132 [Coccidioides immitis RMSCC 2394]KMU79356.1 hypothetical protein CISG_07760 [Coccidioides immitis RMSCC 3703]KMU90112.1 hypothetical protein CIHG_07922 [Coccidioides immitis H538.4]
MSFFLSDDDVAEGSVEPSWVKSHSRLPADRSTLSVEIASSSTRPFVQRSPVPAPLRWADTLPDFLHFNDDDVPECFLRYHRVVMKAITVFSDQEPRHKNKLPSTFRPVAILIMLDWDIRSLHRLSPPVPSSERSTEPCAPGVPTV